MLRHTGYFDADIHADWHRLRNRPGLRHHTGHHLLEFTDEACEEDHGMGITQLGSCGINCDSLPSAFRHILGCQRRPHV